jgi:hypothetical protein
MGNRQDACSTGNGELEKIVFYKLGKMAMNRRGRSLALGLVTLALLIGLDLGRVEARSSSPPAEFSVPSSAIAQIPRPTEVWPQVYQWLPDVPQENNYVLEETGEADADNTLVGRLVRYHFYVKRRPPNFRFDWKLTVADYLGANELMQESIYPGYESLKENPMEGDRQAIKSMTRDQRNALVDVLVEIFGGYTPEAENSSPATPPTPEPSTPRLPPLPQPGDADLLR